MPDWAGPPGWVSALALLIALALDRCWGEPPNGCHPVAGMGRYLGWTGRQLQRFARQEMPFAQHGTRPASPDLGVFGLGAAAWLVGAGLVCAAAWILQKGFMLLPDRLGPIPGALPAALLLGLPGAPAGGYAARHAAGIQSGQDPVADLAGRHPVCGITGDPMKTLKLSARRLHGGHPACLGSAGASRRRGALA